MESNEGHSIAKKFFNKSNSSSYDSVVKYATLFQDSKWKQIISDKIDGSHNILELACGTGILSAILARDHRAVLCGLDLTYSYLERYINRISSTAVQGTAELIPYRAESFDAVVSSYLAKYVDIDLTANESKRVLKSGGIVIFHDFTKPSDIAIYYLWRAYFCILRFGGAFLTPWREVFNELEGVISHSGWVKDAENALKSNGYCDVESISLTGGTAKIVLGRKP